MRERLVDIRMADGQRHFGDMPETYSAERPEWDRIRDAVPRLAGAELGAFVTDGVTEAWIDFTYRGHAFSMNNQQGDWWFFVADPTCPNEVLLSVLDHFEALLLPTVARARAEGPVPAGALRVVVYENDGRVTCRDFSDGALARAYADDAASETEDGIVLSFVLDDRLRVVHEGKHY